MDKDLHSDDTGFLDCGAVETVTQDTIGNDNPENMENDNIVWGQFAPSTNP